MAKIKLPESLKPRTEAVLKVPKEGRIGLNKTGRGDLIWGQIILTKIFWLFNGYIAVQSLAFAAEAPRSQETK